MSVADRRESPTQTSVLALTATGLLSGCRQNAQSALYPAGPAAERIADVWWLMLAVASAVFILVVAILIWALTHKGPRLEARTATSNPGLTRWIVAGGVVLPTVILLPLLVFALQTMSGLAKPKSSSAPEVVITGSQWWWDVLYEADDPRLRVRTANEIHIPVGRPVPVRLLSKDVIHSFWVPSLQGKLDLIPGKENTTWIQADSAGVYRGECAEYCGLQHTRMQFRVIAMPPEDFATWLDAQRAPAVAPDDSAAQEGQAVFLRSGCALCHAIRGTSARAATGPDLTHLGSRMTLAAGTIPNSPGHLAGWIGNPQGIKPGNLMPRIPLRPAELHALLAYLGSLR